MTDYSVFAVREKEGWDSGSVVETYVNRFGPVVDAAAEAHLPIVRDAGHVLDLCCGPGTLTARLLASGHKVTGLDFSPTMLEHARVAAPGATLIEGDAQNMPFDDESFDAITCNFGIMHLPDQVAGLREVRRVLRPDGLFSMTSWFGPERSDAFRLIFSGVQKHMPAGQSRPPQPDFFLYSRPDDAAAFLEGAGLIVRSHGALDLAWEFTAAGDLFDAFLNGTVGARMALMSLPEANRAALRAEIIETAEADYRDGDVFRIPVPAAHLVATVG